MSGSRARENASFSLISSALGKRKWRRRRLGRVGLLDFGERFLIRGVRFDRLFIEIKSFGNGYVTQLL
jgi:hypothetical protein